MEIEAPWERLSRLSAASQNINESLDVDTSLRRVTVELTDTEYAVLYELAAHAPRTLTHAVLLQRVWGPGRVGDAWLVRNVVKLLRRKQGDDADNPRYIFTEPRGGYRMASGASPEMNEE